MLVKGYQWKNADLKEFPDTADHWAQDYIAVAAGRGVVEGYDDGNFGPEELITREQIAAMITRLPSWRVRWKGRNCRCRRDCRLGPGFSATGQC